MWPDSAFDGGPGRTPDDAAASRVPVRGRLGSPHVVRRRISDLEEELLDLREQTRKWRETAWDEGYMAGALKTSVPDRVRNPYRRTT